MKLGTVLSRSALVAASLAMFAGTARADGVLGQPLIKHGDIQVRFVGSDAFYDDDLWFMMNVGDFSTATFLFNNHTSAAGDAVDPDDSFLNVGDEAIFGLCVNTAGTDDGHDGCVSSDHIYYSGSAGALGDDADTPPHTKVWTRADYENEFGALDTNLFPPEYTYIIGFEDILGGGDLDYNDAIFALQGVTAVPEPVTMTLLATGLAGMGGAGLVRRRKKNT
jgi:hypothetical protein